MSVWLVNTGWSGGPYGVGRRIKLANTRAILDAIHAGALTHAPTEREPFFGLHVVTGCPNVSQGHPRPEIDLERPRQLRRGRDEAGNAVPEQFSDLRRRRA